MPRSVGIRDRGPQATILKKCSREFHRPETNKQCASGTCQHTCEAAETEPCRHAWIVRYMVDEVQRDRSFGRVRVLEYKTKVTESQLEAVAANPPSPSADFRIIRVNRHGELIRSGEVQYILEACMT
jgi:hypothetical protein